MIRILLSTRLGERKWTQADLVRETGIRASTINDLYHEMTDRVSLEQLDQMMRVLTKRLGMRGPEFKTARLHLTAAFETAPAVTAA